MGGRGLGSFEGYWNILPFYVLDLPCLPKYRTKSKSNHVRIKYCKCKDTRSTLPIMQPIFIYQNTVTLCISIGQAWQQLRSSSTRGLRLYLAAE